MKTKIILAMSLLGLVTLSFTVPVTAPVQQLLFRDSQGLVWKSTEISLGDIPHNVPVPIEFSFQNKSKEVVLINSVQASCGCTTVKYTQTPIRPGETAVINAVYNAATQGKFHKTITVKTTADFSPVTLSFSGVVL